MKCGSFWTLALAFVAAASRIFSFAVDEPAAAQQYIFDRRCYSDSALPNPSLCLWRDRPESYKSDRTPLPWCGDRCRCDIDRSRRVLHWEVRTTPDNRHVP